MSTVRRQTDPVSRAEANQQLYEADEHEWMARQIAAMRSGTLHELDCENLAEFLDDSMKRDRRELRSRFSRLLQHLVKLKMQPEKMTRSWVLTIVHQQNAVRRLFRGIPSMRQHADRPFSEAYEDAVREAGAETGIPARQFPTTTPWTMDEALAFEPEMPEPTPPPRKRKLPASGARR